MVAEGVAAGVLGDALLDGDLLGRSVVGDADVDGAGLQVLDCVRGVALVPADFEGLGTVCDAVFDVGKGEF